MPSMVFKTMLAKSVSVASRRIGHSGTNLPGRIALALDSRLLERISRNLSEGAIVVTATNGKTTTAAMIAMILEIEGLRVARNREGANLKSGVTTAIIKDSSMAGRPRAEIGLFEVDEAAFPEVAYQCAPRVALLMNLFRDQLDRYGELEHISEIWRASIRAMSDETLTVLNADDPVIADLASIRPERSLLFGIEDAAIGGQVMPHASDSKYCTVCGAPLDYEAIFTGHLGMYHCPSCGNDRPSPTIQARSVHLDGMHGSRFSLVTPEGSAEVKLHLPGLYNVYNALAAAAACVGIGVHVSVIQKGLASASAAFGRVETLTIDGTESLLLLVKNPAGFNEVVRTLMIEPQSKNIMLALNDRIADGRDISWIWDVDIENMAAEVAMAVCSGTRAEEMAMRLKYAGVSAERLVVKDNLEEALREALRLTGDGETLYILPTYTAMLALRQAIHHGFNTDRELGDLVWK